MFVSVVMNGLKIFCGGTLRSTDRIFIYSHAHDFHIYMSVSTLLHSILVFIFLHERLCSLEVHRTVLAFKLSQT